MTRGLAHRLRPHGASQDEIRGCRGRRTSMTSVAATPAGYETRVGERGPALRRRGSSVAIARCPSAQNPPILSLRREATSALGSNNERPFRPELEARGALQDSARVIAHRPLDHPPTRIEILVMGAGRNRRARSATMNRWP